jgi:hypothetical protein
MEKELEVSQPLVKEPISEQYKPVHTLPHTSISSNSLISPASSQELIETK